MQANTASAQDVNQVSRQKCTTLQYKTNIAEWTIPALLIYYVLKYVLQAHSSGLVDLLGVLVTKLRSDIHNQDQDLARQDQGCLQAEQERDAALRRIETLEHQLSVSQSRIGELIKEKEDAASTLKRREFEFQMLRQSATDQIELQQQSIYYKEKEIADLRARLQSVEGELAESKLRIPTLKEDLQTATLELKKKEVEVEVLQETKNDMRLLLDMERRVLDNYLLQLTAARVSHDQYRQEVEVMIAGTFYRSLYSLTS